MTRYFTSRQGAIKRLMDLKRQVARTGYSFANIAGCRADGSEVSGIDAVLLDVRAGRIGYFRHEDANGDQLVYIS
ncbi:MULTISPECIES: hypothetical protein [unclassified Caballeronia]|uniref:hypothetical protein n=1 Tax=unclassified Caballeronia TaxID=2646786 RepID=UPI0028552C6B|nr:MULTISPECIES: hypothetical protein [unclassified Caballeronia]MDR5741394.1 hypothetical protein [Caballeronia sp. LZ016]MDR5807291.1 hypothetical protein [Caballeronia sp. LZ019]